MAVCATGCRALFSKCIYVNSHVFKWRPVVDHFNTSLLKYNRSLCTSTILRERRYTEQHEWIEVQGKVGTVGITDYAQSALGDVVFAQLPDPGAELSQMDDCGALESVKAASELFCPVTGVVVEKNAEVEETPGLINQSPYEKGWLFKIELSKPEEVDSLLDEAGYQKHLTDQGH